MATFYAGSVRLIGGNVEQAKKLLGECMATDQKAFYEYRSAQAELDVLRKGK